MISYNDENKLKIQNSGRYSVKIIDQNGCESELSDYIDIILSVRDNEKKSVLIEISPNPVGEYIEINTNRCQTLSKCLTSEIRIYDVLGECVLSTPKAHPSTGSGFDKIDVSGLAAGVYFVRIGVWTGSFLKIE